MECTLCDQDKNHDLLFSCNNCKKDFCQTHIEGHTCTKKIEPQLDSQTLLKMFLQANQQQREPRPEDFERHFRSSPQYLTTGRETFDLLIASFLLFLVFGLRPLIFGTSTLNEVLLLTLIITPAFLLHELGHKFMAMRFGKYARFVLTRTMTYLTLFVAFTGIGIAGPGVTVSIGKTNVREMGISAASGPLVNMVIALLSYFISLLNLSVTFLGYELNSVLLFSIYINCFLAVFNLLPIFILDGKKVYTWDPLIWLIMFAVNIYGFISTSSIFTVIFGS